jgi:hypothetical protein
MIYLITASIILLAIGFTIILEIHSSKNTNSIKEKKPSITNNNLKQEMDKLNKEIAILNDKLKELLKKD